MKRRFTFHEYPFPPLHLSTTRRHRDEVVTVRPTETCSMNWIDEVQEVDILLLPFSWTVYINTTFKLFILHVSLILLRTVYLT